MLDHVIRSAPLLALLLLGCHGSVDVGGALWAGYDPIEVDDDDTGDDDDATAGDDDDATAPGGEVSCGPEPTLDPSWEGTPAALYTGDAEVEVEYAARGGVFEASWTGCEALHFYDEFGEYFCGIRWSASGDSYAEQIQSSQIGSRFYMTFSLAENTCAPSDPQAEDRSVYFRLTVPDDGGELTVLTSSGVDTPADQMDVWASVPWEGLGPAPEEFDFEYSTATEASGR